MDYKVTIGHIIKINVQIFLVYKINILFFYISEDNVEAEQINCERVVAYRTCRSSDRTMVGCSICQLYIGRI